MLPVQNCRQVNRRDNTHMRRIEIAHAASQQKSVWTSREDVI